MISRETMIVLAVAAGLAAGATLIATALAPDAMVPARTVAGSAGARAPGLDELMARVDAVPDDVEAWRALARTHMAAGHYLPAVEAWTWIRELRPRDPEAASALADLERIARERRVHTIPDPGPGR